MFESVSSKVLLLMALVLIMIMCIYSVPVTLKAACNFIKSPGRVLDTVANMDFSIDLCGDWDWSICD